VATFGNLPVFDMIKVIEHHVRGFTLAV